MVYYVPFDQTYLFVSGIKTTKDTKKNGNLVDDGSFLYYYDCENRLTDVNESDHDFVARYKYDFAGRRVRKIIYSSGQVDTDTRFVYDGDQVIAEYDYNDTSAEYELARKYVYGPGIDEPICMIDCTDGDSVYYYHYDALGNVVALSDEDQDIAESYAYDAFGKTVIFDDQTQIQTESQIGNPYMFTGRRFDDESGLYYYRYRFYKSDIGRFVQPDPIGYAGGINLYAYVYNNPLKYTDPFGLDIWITHPGGWHSAINVGNPNGEYWSYSYMLKSPHFTNVWWPFGNSDWLKGEVYSDAWESDLISRYHKTTPKQDCAIKGALDDSIGEEGPYNPIINCHSWSHAVFNELKNQYPNEELNRTHIEIDYGGPLAPIGIYPIRRGR